MSDFEIRINNTAQVQAALAAIPQEAFLEFQKTFRTITQKFIRKMTVERLSGRPGLNRLSGSLARSLRAATIGNNLNTLRSIIFFDASMTKTKSGTSYAAVHEYGAIIRPRTGKYLTIPIRAGSPFAISAGLGPRKARALSSKIVGFRKVRQVVIPPRLKFFETWNSVDNQSSINADMKAAAASVVTKFNRGKK